MNHKFKKLGWLLLISFATSSCSANTYGIKDLEKNLNYRVGKFYEYPTFDSNPYWKHLSETSDQVEMEQRSDNGCSYAIIINKETRVVKGWRYTSDRSLCDELRQNPGI